MLTTLRHATNLHHIKILRINEQRNVLHGLFPTIIAALSAIPHGKMHIEINLDWNSLSNANLALLSTISPASLYLDAMTLIPGQAQLLMRVRYPLKLSIQDQISETDMLTLPTIPHLVAFGADAHVSENVVRAFTGHPALTHLKIEIGDVDISDALVALTSNTQLKTLIIKNRGSAFSEEAFAALAANRTLESLSLSGFNDHWEAGIGEKGALILSKNTTLKALHISLKGGYRHLADMASLENLTIEEGGSPITSADAHEFAQRARLKTLKIVRDAEPGDSEPDACVGALTHLLSSAVENVHLVFVNLRTEDIVALTANNTLRSFEREYRGFSETDFALSFALAAHPTLRSLRIYPEEDEQADTFHSAYTRKQMATLSATWAAGKRPESSFFIDA